MLRTTTLVILPLVLLACGQGDTQEQPVNSLDSVAIDSIAIVNDPKNNLNIQTNSFTEIDSSGIVMFPLSMSETKRGNGSFSYKKMPDNYFWNIIFYNSNSGSYHLLGNQKMLISNYDIKYSNYDDGNIESSFNYIFYKIIVEDFNNDKKLTPDDPQYLFVTDKTGNSFRQISPVGYTINTWKFIKSTNKVLMTVTRDTNNDKNFEDKDEVAAFQIDIEKDTQPTEIFPAEFKNKLKIMYDTDWKRLNE